MERDESGSRPTEAGAGDEHIPGFGERSPEALLEYDRVLELLAGHTHFSLSRTLALRSEPAWSFAEVLRLQDETAEARLLLDSAGDIGNCP